MKNVVICICLAVLTIALSKPLSPSDIAHAHSNCVNQTGVDREVIEKVKSTLKMPPLESKYTEYLTCIYKKQNYQDENGDILHTNIKEFAAQYFKADEVDEFIEPCKAERRGETHGEKAYFALDCMLVGLRAINTTSS